MNTSMLEDRIFKGTICVLVLLCVFLLGIVLSPKVKLHCNDFSSQEEAQAAYNADSLRLKGLDRGGEAGIACENFNY